MWLVEIQKSVSWLFHRYYKLEDKHIAHIVSFTYLLRCLLDAGLALAMKGTGCYAATNECSCADQFALLEISIAQYELVNYDPELVMLQ